MTEMVQLRIANNISDYDKDWGPSYTDEMLSMIGEEFKIPKEEWENAELMNALDEEDSGAWITYEGWYFTPSWLIEVNKIPSILEQGNEL